MRYPYQYQIPIEPVLGGTGVPPPILCQAQVSRTNWVVRVYLQLSQGFYPSSVRTGTKCFGTDRFDTHTTHTSSLGTWYWYGIWVDTSPSFRRVSPVFMGVVAQRLNSSIPRACFASKWLRVSPMCRSATVNNRPRPGVLGQAVLSDRVPILVSPTLSGHGSEE